MDSFIKTPKIVLEKTGTLIMNLTVEKQAAHSQMNALQKRATTLNHPLPENKTAKKHLEKLRSLGYNSYAETGIEYWEPKYAFDTSSQHNARRQRECIEMSTFLKKATHKIHDQIASQNLFMPDAPEKYSFTVGSKRPAGTDEPNQTVKHRKESPLADSLRAMKQELEKEKKARKKLEEQVTTLTTQVSTLCQTVRDLLKELEEEKSNTRSTATATTAKAKTKAPRPCNTAEEEEEGLRKLVQEIVTPILQAATSMPPTTTKAKKPQSGTPQAPTYSQVVGTGPATTYHKEETATAQSKPRTPTTALHQQHHTASRTRTGHVHRRGIYNTLKSEAKAETTRTKASQTAKGNRQSRSKVTKMSTTPNHTESKASNPAPPP